MSWRYEIVQQRAPEAADVEWYYGLSEVYRKGKVVTGYTDSLIGWFESKAELRETLRMMTRDARARRRVRVEVKP